MPDGTHAGCLALQLLRTTLLAVLAAAATGCSTLGYYWQAARGELSLLAAARPIPDWLADPTTPPSLKERLALAQRIRAFASHDLGLPDNRSYTRYTDLKRTSAVWNVFATPELSLELKTWCYPIFGCAQYRGYFAQADAEALARHLAAEGDDVEVGAIPAFSTLGWFSDPLLSTFIDWPEPELAGLIFHELAHQTVYVSDDTVFNESYATAVEHEGLRRWIAVRGDPSLGDAYRNDDTRRAEFQSLLLQARARLKAVYDERGSSTDAEVRARKAAVLADLSQRYQALRNGAWGGYARYDRYFARPINNARLAAVGAYYDDVPAFEALLARQHGDLPRFYAAVRALAKTPKAERDEALRALAPLPEAARQPVP